MSEDGFQYSKSAGALAGIQISFEEQIVRELLKKFPIESLGRFRDGEAVCYTHAASGVGFRIKWDYSDTDMKLVAVPGTYFPKPEPTE
jgi:hypothetical protein